MQRFISAATCKLLAICVGVESSCELPFESELALEAANRSLVKVDPRRLQAGFHMAAGAINPLPDRIAMGGISVAASGFDLGVFFAISGRPGVHFRSGF